MTISAQTVAISYTGNGATTVFAYNFRVLDATHLKVYINGVLQVGGYSVSGIDAPGGGNVTFVAAPANGVAILFQRVTAKTQEVDYTPYDAFPSETHERALDKLTMLVQESSSGSDHSIKIPASEDATAVNTTVPDVATRANQFVSFDASGNVIVGLPVGGGVTVTPFMQTLLDDTTQAAGRTTLGVSPTQLEAEQNAARNALVDYLHVDFDTAQRDLAKVAYEPGFFNQQWGGAPHYFELVDQTGTLQIFESATGYIDDNDNTQPVGDAAARTWGFQGFKVSKACTPAAIWIKIYKVGNPTNNLELRILPDDGTGKPSGSTAISNGTATAQSGKLFTADVAGAWVRFPFPTPPSLTAGTQYHITLKSSGAVDASNYWIWRRCLSSINTPRYPHGNNGTGDGTPTWSAGTNDMIFLVENLAADATIRTGGIFGDGRVVAFEGAPLDQSSVKVKDLRLFNGLDLTDFTFGLFGTAWTKDKTILDITYGLDHDRIVVRSNVTTGFAQIDVYDSAGTKKTVTGGLDISSGDSLIGIRIRAKGDGADVVELWENGAKNANSLSAQTISFDKNFGSARLGTVWVGGGFAVAPTYTQKLAMGVLPSADSPAWTWTTTTATGEAGAMSVAGGKLYQNKNGYAAGGDGYYAKNALGLSNANGWLVGMKFRVASDPNTKDVSPCFINIYDGTKLTSVDFKEYYHQSAAFAAQYYVQAEAKNSEHTYTLLGKGSDLLVFMDGRLTLDGTGMATSASALNQIFFGDGSTTSGENADVVWDYVGYYNTAWTPPQVSSGSFSEFGFWNGDHTSLFATLWNGGAPLSIKQLTRLSKNYIDAALRNFNQKGITLSPSTSGTTQLSEPDMEVFAIGADFDVRHNFNANFPGAAEVTRFTLTIDGVTYTLQNGSVETGTPPAAGNPLPVHRAHRLTPPFGLHKFERRFAANGGGNAVTINGNQSRQMNVDVR